MAGEVLPVGLGEARFTSSRDDVLAIYGLGSCVALTLFDLEAGVGGLCHIMLPSSNGNSLNSLTGSPARFADACVPWAVRQLEGIGASRKRIRAKLAGGANMFPGTAGAGSSLSIGERNAAMVTKSLAAEGIRVVSSDIGGSRGRSVFFSLADCMLIIRTLGRVEYI